MRVLEACLGKPLAQRPARPLPTPQRALRSRAEAWHVVAHSWRMAFCVTSASLFTAPSAQIFFHTATLVTCTRACTCARRACARPQCTRARAARARCGTVRCPAPHAWGRMQCHARAHGAAPWHARAQVGHAWWWRVLGEGGLARAPHLELLARRRVVPADRSHSGGVHSACQAVGMVGFELGAGRDAPALHGTGGWCRRQRRAAAAGSSKTAGGGSRRQWPPLPVVAHASSTSAAADMISRRRCPAAASGGAVRLAAGNHKRCTRRATRRTGRSSLARCQETGSADSSVALDSETCCA